MKQTFKLFTLAALLVAGVAACESGTSDEEKEQYRTGTDREYLSKWDSEYSSQWTDEERQLANSGSEATYLTSLEKEIYYYFNLMRINPPLFAKTYAQAYDGDLGWTKGYAWDERKASLIRQLSGMSPLPLIQPDEDLYWSADCYATNGGALGMTGHDRTGSGCSKNPGRAECLDFGGISTGLAVVMHLLIDAGENNANLGHRKIMLDGTLTTMGAAVRKHKNYETMAVLDFAN